MTGVMDRRTLLLGGGCAAGLAAIGALAWPVLPDRAKRLVGLGEDPWLPDSPLGTVSLETVYSQARGTDVQLYTAVPAGHGDGSGLPVVVVLHGASATAADFVSFQLGRFVTAAAEQGAQPFVLAGADGGVLHWEPQPDGDDPQLMVLEEVPAWLAERGFDVSRKAAWGWSMGGYGVLRLAERAPQWATATAAFSPAVSEGDAVFSGAAGLAGHRLGLWCGTSDPFYDEVRALLDVLPTPPAVTTFDEGGHTRVFWNQHTLEAFEFLAESLGRSG